MMNADMDEPGTCLVSLALTVQVQQWLYIQDSWPPSLHGTSVYIIK